MAKEIPFAQAPTSAEPPPVPRSMRQADDTGALKREQRQPIDRKEAVDAYAAQYPDDCWDYDLHIIVEDYNFEDHWLFGGIASIAAKLKEDEENADLRRRFHLLVNLLALPMPEGWEDDENG